MDIHYHRSGDYLFPDLTISEESVGYGKYGMLRKYYLKANKANWYRSMLLSGKLDSHLMEIDHAANDRMECIVSQMAKAENLTEQLKALDPILWFSRMNNDCHRAEEIVLNELIYL